MILHLTHWVTKQINNNELTLFHWKTNNSVDIFDNNHPAYRFLDNKFINVNLDELSDEYREDIEWLIDENFLAEETQLVYLESKVVRKTPFQLILLPAGEACNLNCVYCYEDHSDRSSMNIEHQQVLLKFIKKQNKDDVSIEYFGGEPTLNMKFIEQFSTLLYENSIKFRGSITTNGTLINEKTLEKLYKANIKSFQITLDGYRELHNKLRPSKNGSIDSFENVTNALKIIANSKYEDINVTLRLNVNAESISTDNFRDFTNTIENVIPKKDSRFFILPKIISDYSSLNLFENEQAKTTYCSSRDSANSVTEKFETYIDENYQSASALLLTKEGGFSCYAGNPYSFVITPDLKVRKCTVALNDPINFVGYLTNDGELKKTIHFDLWVKDYSDQNCGKCFMNKSCQGNSCPLENIKKDRKICPPFRYQPNILTSKVINFYNRSEFYE